MLVIRLQRIGKKHQPSYRVAVAEARSKLGGEPVEDLGSYNPKTKQATVSRERVLYWVGAGAKPSPTVHNLLLREGVLSGAKMRIKIKAKGKGESPAAAPEAVAPAPAATGVSTEGATATAEVSAESATAEAPVENAAPAAE